MTEIDKTAALKRSVLGAELTDDEAAVLASKMGVEQLKQGDILVREGEPRHTLFVLADGRLGVCKAGDDRELTIYQLRNGECAGTRAFLDASARKAKLRAETDAVVLTLEPEEFESLVDDNPRLVYKVMRALFRVTHSNLMRMNLESSELRNYLMKTGGRY